MRLSPVRELSMEEAIVEKRELEEEEEEEEKGGQHKWAEFCSEFAWKNIWFHGKDKVFRGWTDIGENLLIGLFFALLSIFDVGSDSWSAWRFIAVKRQCLLYLPRWESESCERIFEALQACFSFVNSNRVMFRFWFGDDYTKTVASEDDPYVTGNFTNCTKVVIIFSSENVSWSRQFQLKIPRYELVSISPRLVTITTTPQQKFPASLLSVEKATRCSHYPSQVLNQLIPLWRFVPDSPYSSWCCHPSTCPWRWPAEAPGGCRWPSPWPSFPSPSPCSSSNWPPLSTLASSSRLSILWWPRQKQGTDMSVLVHFSKCVIPKNGVLSSAVASFLLGGVPQKCMF